MIYRISVNPNRERVFAVRLSFNSYQLVHTSCLRPLHSYKIKGGGGGLSGIIYILLILHWAHLHAYFTPSPILWFQSHSPDLLRYRRGSSATFTEWAPRWSDHLNISIAMRRKQKKINKAMDGNGQKNYFFVIWNGTYTVYTLWENHPPIQRSISDMLLSVVDFQGSCRWKDYSPRTATRHGCGSSLFKHKLCKYLTFWIPFR